MFRWLPESSLSDHGKVVTSFWNRIAELDHAGGDARRAVSVAVVRIWRYFVGHAGSLDGFRAMTHDNQKQLLVKLIDYEARCLKDGPEAEGIAAELLSYFIAMVAAGDGEEEQRMTPPLVELARQFQSDFELAETRNGGSAAGMTNRPRHNGALEENPMAITASYKATRLLFKRDVIERLSPNGIFEVDVRDQGLFRMTRAEFEDVFRNILSTKSWKTLGVYHYPKTPQKALPFRV